VTQEHNSESKDSTTHAQVPAHATNQSDSNVAGGSYPDNTHSKINWTNCNDDYKSPPDGIIDIGEIIHSCGSSIINDGLLYGLGTQDSVRVALKREDPSGKGKNVRKSIFTL
jgi:hypothetical protein